MLKIPNSKMTQKSIKIFINETYSKGQKRIIAQAKQTHSILMTFGV